ncbi:MAG: hypothetical protein ACHQK9_15430 [Reyranellales bacterium]
MAVAKVSNPPPKGVFELIDVAAKAVALVVAFSLLMGITYNVVFFSFTKPVWLFHLSIADNIAATLYALPVVFGVLVVQAAGTVFFWFVLNSQRLLESRLEPWIPMAWDRVSWMIPIVVTAFGVVLVGSVIWAFSLGSLDEVFAIVGLTLTDPRVMIYAAWLLGSMVWAAVLIQRESTFRIFVHVSTLIVVMPFASVVLLGVEAGRHRGYAAEIELSDRALSWDSKATARGFIVRVLEGGVILEQGPDWIWLPRAEIRRIAEFEPPRGR